jgi:hypothetical protein
MAIRAAELYGVEPAPPDDPDTVKVRAEGLIADLVEPAKADGLEKLGESRQAFDIAAVGCGGSWLRECRCGRATSRHLTAR